jgi:peptidoglycan/xylan/chitin deacetylase (PgdA/CDA1 family)
MPVMDVFLTIDVETYTGDYALDVYGGGNGLDYICRTCNEHGVRATFFVEALGATRWGLEHVADVCRHISRSGHEVQLHVHPSVARLEGFDTADDHLWSYDKAGQKRLILTGLDILHRCGQKGVVAFRAGDLTANEDTLAAMEEASLRLGSNRDLDCKGSIQSRINDSFPVRNDLSRRGSLVDLPLSAFRSPLPWLDGEYRHLEICAVGALEMADALSRMASSGYACATILTHPHQFFRVRGGGTIGNRKNRWRLLSLLRFVTGRQDMRFRTVSECLAIAHVPERSPGDVTVRLPYSLLRLWAQAPDRMRRILRKTVAAVARRHGKDAGPSTAAGNGAGALHDGGSIESGMRRGWPHQGGGP